MKLNKVTSMSMGLYAGSFDPLHNGHYWTIREGAKRFDELIIGVAVNSFKVKPFFTLEERMKMIKETVEGHSNVRIEQIPKDKLTVNFARSLGVDYLLRGIRDSADSESEIKIAYWNRKIQPEITTLLVVPPLELSLLSSSSVREIYGKEGWEELVKEYVPAPVYDKLCERFRNESK